MSALRTSALGFNVAIIALGLLVVFESQGLGFGTAKEPGPGFFPLLVGLLIAISAAAVLIRTISNRYPATGEAVFGEGGLARFVGMVAFFCLWQIAIPWLGFIPVTLVVSLGFAKTMGLRGWVLPLLLAAGITFAIYMIFDVWLYTDLPRGLLE